jgi:AraC family transcriptional regulator
MSSRSFEMAAEELLRAAQSARCGSGNTARECIGRALVLLNGSPLRANGTGGLTAWRARKVATHIESSLGEPIKVRELARVAGLSAGHFSRAFRRRFGITARAYLASRRISLAKERMLKTDSPLSEIALQCGMADQSHFIRTFRRIEGVTPSQWRESQRF